jgi:transcriptional regulator with XRE-family HTH domain
MSFAEIARQTGSSRTHIADIEHGDSDLSFSLAVRISEALGVDVRYFVLQTPGRPHPAKASSKPIIEP